MASAALRRKNSNRIWIYFIFELVSRFILYSSKNIHSFSARDHKTASKEVRTDNGYIKYGLAVILIPFDNFITMSKK